MKRWVGLALIAISASAFGTLAILGHYAYADGMDAITILFLRFSLAAGVMAILLVVRREALPRGSALLRLIGMGAVGYVGQAFCYFTALKFASSGLVALLLYLYPTFVLLLSVMVLRERVTGFKWLALGLALVGTALTVTPEGGQFLGIVLAILAAMIYSVYIIVGAQVLKQVSPVQSSTIIFASAGVTSGGLMMVNGAHWPATSTGWVVIVGIVLLATVLPVLTFLAGLERIGPTNAAMLSVLEPVVTILLAALFLNETLQPLSLLGGGLILLAVVLLTHGEFRRPHPASSSDP